MPETFTLPLRGGDFTAEIQQGGAGPPLLYLHGAAGPRPFPEGLARQFRVTAPSLPGYGGATGLEHLDDPIDLALYCLELAEALGLERPHLVGHFLGGMAAAEMAALSPPSVGRLALVSPAGLWRDAAPSADLLALSAAELLAGMLSPATPSDGPVASAVREALAAGRMPDLAAAGKFLWPIPDRGLRRRAYRIKAPALILWGADDGLNPPAYAAEFQALIADSQTALLPQAGHLPMLEQPAAFAEAVAAFLNGG